MVDLASDGFRDQPRKENGSDDDPADFLMDWTDLFRCNSS